MNRDGKKYIKTKNILKLETKINKLQKHLTSIRNDYRHKTTTAIVKTKPCRIVVEDLNISGMLKNKHLSKSISQQGFYEFITMLEYKCLRDGIHHQRLVQNVGIKNLNYHYLKENLSVKTVAV